MHGRLELIDLPTLNGLLDWLPERRPAGGRAAENGRADGLPGDRRPGHPASGDPAPVQRRAVPIEHVLRVGGPGTVGNKSGGSGAAATYYTTDGSTPTSSSPTFSTPFIITRSETLTFYSVDNAGNAEQVQTITVLDQPHADPVVGAAGDIACDPTAPAFNGGDGTATDCRAKATGNLMTGVDAACRSVTRSTTVAA